MIEFNYKESNFEIIYKIYSAKNKSILPLLNILLPKIRIYWKL